jgi:CopG family transcriptional regulator, nickel-responsive regulator
MKQELVRFGVAMEPMLLAQLDHLAEQRGSNRSELLRDLARAEVVRSLVQKRVPAVASITLVYNHHVRELTERLNGIQHELEDQVRSTMHVHLDHDHCLEVIVMRGRSDVLKAAADRLLGTRGVTHGGVEIIAETAMGESDADHPHGHADHDHPHPHRPAAAAARTRRKS